MSELRPVAHGRVDVEHGLLADEHVPAQSDRSGLDAPRVGPVAEEVRLLPYDRSGADREQIGAYRHAAGEDHDAWPDPRPQRPQIERVERRADEEQGTRVGADQRLDDPEADVGQAPDLNLIPFPATDERPLGRDRKGAHDEEADDARDDQPQVDRDAAGSR